ncbi:MAG TPA: ChbG/HpnK family deacetylase [Solirubrobacteraceae bacterium]|nr:ChbG/HpnK family deacetylase [Solirubrobacteraceae bacterium]
MSRAGSGLLIVNADDFGGNRLATDRILEGFGAGALTSATAMMFMADSRRAATLGRDAQIPTGLHLNLTQEYDDPEVPPAVAARQRRVTEFLADPRQRRTRFSPSMVAVIRDVIGDQLGAFRVCFGAEPTHLDGHNHAHLNPSALLALPRGMAVRPAYRDPDRRGLRRVVLSLRDRALAARHPGPDHFYALTAIHPELGGHGWEPAVARARTARVEIMVHPDRDRSYAILTSDAWGAVLRGLPLGTYADLAARR